MTQHLAAVDFGGAVTDGFRTIATFIPKLIGFLLILIVGYFIAKIVSKIVGKLLERVGFDGVVERGGIKRALAKSKMDAKALENQEALLDNSVRENVLRVVNRLRTAEALLLEPLRAKTLMVVGARYDLDDGNVEFFEG